MYWSPYPHLTLRVLVPVSASDSPLIGLYTIVSCLLVLSTNHTCTWLSCYFDLLNPRILFLTHFMDRFLAFSRSTAVKKFATETDRKRLRVLSSTPRTPRTPRETSARLAGLTQARRLRATRNLRATFTSGPAAVLPRAAPLRAPRAGRSLEIGTRRHPPMASADFVPPTSPPTGSAGEGSGVARRNRGSFSPHLPRQ